MTGKQSIRGAFIKGINYTERVLYIEDSMSGAIHEIALSKEDKPEDFEGDFGDYVFYDEKSLKIID